MVLKNHNKWVDTALHIIKGALVEAKLVARTGRSTTRVHFSEKPNQGAIHVHCEAAPTPEQLQQVEIIANRKITENVPIIITEMSRKEAEEKFGDEMYDRFPVPDHVQQLKILQIPPNNFNINCCPAPHCNTTGELGKLRILKHRFRDAKKELEVNFEVFPQQYQQQQQQQQQQ